MKHIFQRFCSIQLNKKYILDAFTGTVRSNPTKNVDGPQSVGFLSVAIPLVISGVVLTFILLLVCYRCRKKQEAYYGEAYEFSLVDQSIVRIIYLSTLKIITYMGFFYIVKMIAFNNWDKMGCGLVKENSKLNYEVESLKT